MRQKCYPKALLHASVGINEEINDAEPPVLSTERLDEANIPQFLPGHADTSPKVAQW
jgi:hypothetical protein